jgi:hypothetical protein
MVFTLVTRLAVCAELASCLSAYARADVGTQGVHHLLHDLGHPLCLIVSRPQHHQVDIPFASWQRHLFSALDETRAAHGSCVASFTAKIVRSLKKIFVHII